MFLKLNSMLDFGAILGEKFCKELKYFNVRDAVNEVIEL